VTPGEVGEQRQVTVAGGSRVHGGMRSASHSPCAKGTIGREALQQQGPARWMSGDAEPSRRRRRGRVEQEYEPRRKTWCYPAEHELPHSARSARYVDVGADQRISTASVYAG